MSKASTNKASKSALKSKKPSIASSIIKIPEAPEKPEIVHEEKTVKIEVKEIFVTPIAGKPSPTEIMIQVDHLKETIGESEMIPCNPEGSTKVNYSLELKVFPTKPGGIDEIVSNPILFTVLDSSQKPSVKDSPKKGGGKEIKASSYGRSNLDLLPIFLGERTLNECLLLEQDKKVVGQEVIPWPNLPRLLVSVEVCEPMMSAAKRKLQNILHVTVESLHNLLPEMTENINYKAAIAFPTFSESFQPIYFDNGMYSHSYEPEYFRKWTDFSFIEGRANLSKYSLCHDLEDVKADPPIDLSKIPNSEAPCVEWYAVKRCWLNKPGVATIFNNLTRYKCWPIEITGAPKAGATGKSGKSKSKTSDRNFHFIAYLDVTALLYPGETTIRVASQLYTFNSETAKEKCGLEKSLLDTSETEAEDGKSVQQKKSDKKSAKSPVVTVEAEEPSEPVFTEDGQPVFIIVELELLRPFIGKWKSEDILKSLSEAIPPREELPKQAMSAEAADVHYNHCIKIVSEIISTEFQDYCCCNESIEENMLDDFFIYLQSNEIFGKIVNILRDKVTVLIREKYSPGVTFNSNEEKQNFISEVYINLVEEMHSILHSILDGGDKATEKTYDVTSDQRYFFAVESSEEGDGEKAKQLYLERISKCKKNPEFWLDYALFCIHTGETAQARESIREALSLDIRHPLGLLLYGIMLATNGDLPEAELFFGAVIHFYPRIVEAWVICHLYYISIERNEGAYITLRQAKKLMAQCRERLNYLCISSEPLAWSTTVMMHESVFLITTKLLLKLQAYQFSEMALAQEILHHGTSIAYKYYLSVGHYLSGRYNEAISHLQDIVEEDFKHYLARSLIGHCYYKLGDKKKAADCYNFIVDAEDRPKDLHLVHIRSRMRECDITNITCSGSTTTNLRIVQRSLPQCPELQQHGGQLCSRSVQTLSNVFHFMPKVKHLFMFGKPLTHELIKLFRSFEALMDESQCDHYLARSLIGHCYYKLGDKKKAADCYNFIVDAEDRPKDLHLVHIRLGIYNVQVNNFQKAKENFLEACLSYPSPRTWLGYGSACFMAGDMEEAEKAFTEANMLDPQCPNIWAYLCLINIHLDREEEYSQCYRQLLKNQNIVDEKGGLHTHIDPI